MIDEDEPFRLEEATIDKLHRAIKAGRTTCVAIVRHYIERARAFNGVASALVTKDGAPVPVATGAVRAGMPLRFPTETVKRLDHPARSRQVPRPAARDPRLDARPDASTPVKVGKQGE